MKATTILFAVILATFSIASNCMGNPPLTTILQTANYPVTGILGNQHGVALTVGQFQFPSVRFSLTQFTQIAEIGGNLFDDGNTGNFEFFGAIAAIDPSTNFPAALPTMFQPIAETTFIPSGSSSDTLVPLSVTLAPGNYALIFGSNRFGATGQGGMSFMSGDIGQPSFFLGAIHNTTGTDQNWNNGDFSVDNLRFVIMGSIVPEPSTITLLSLGAIGLLIGRRRFAN